MARMGKKTGKAGSTTGSRAKAQARTGRSASARKAVKAAPKARAKAAPAKAAVRKAVKAAPKTRSALAAGKSAASAKSMPIKSMPTKPAPAKTAAAKTASARTVSTKAAPRPAARRARPARAASPAPKRPRPPQRVAISHYRNDDFQPGLRDYAAYRDLGIASATHGMVRAHVLRFTRPCDPEEVSKLHWHDTEFQMVYVLKGWVKTELGGHGEITMRAGSAWTQPPRIKHKINDYSADAELLEIILPAEFETVEVAK